jgi:hypothetical protein
MKITILKHIDMMCERTAPGVGLEIEWTHFYPTTLNVSPYFRDPDFRLEIYEDDMPWYILRDYYGPYVINISAVEDHLEEGDIEICDALREYLVRWQNEDN